VTTPRGNVKTACKTIRPSLTVGSAEEDHAVLSGFLKKVQKLLDLIRKCGKCRTGNNPISGINLRWINLCTSQTSV